MNNWINNPDYQDSNGHGTHIAGLILRDTCPEVELISCKYYDETYTNKQNIDNSVICFKKAMNSDYDIINYSSGGTSRNDNEFNVLKRIHTTIVVAAGNNSQDLNKSTYYPASYGLKNIIVVGNLNGKFRSLNSNFGLVNMVWEQGTNILSTYLGGRFVYMTGTSQSTAIHTNRLLKEMCRK